jgi:AraC family transcriptional regulator
MDYYENVKKAIQFIEDNLKEDIYVEDIAREAFYSQFHFMGIFLELTGETPGAYLRKRRLTEAASDILTGRDILEVAIDYHFNSQEAFTRSFKDFFSITPGLYKTNGSINMGLPKPELKEKLSLTPKGGILPMNKQPKIKELPEFKIIGYPYYGIPDRVPEMWGKFEKIYSEIYKQELKEKTCALIFNCHREINYMISIYVDTLDKDIPMQFTGKIVPAATWAMFEVTGEDIDETMAYAHSEWFPKSGYEYSMPCEMEIREENFEYYPHRQVDATKVFYYCYPVKKRGK